MRGNLHGFRLATLLQQQERVVRVLHRHLLDAVAGDDGDRIDHGAADAEGLHVWRSCASGSSRNRSSSEDSHRRTPPVMPAVLLTVFTFIGSANVIRRALP